MKSVIQIWKAKGQILEGIKNNIFKNEHVEEIADKRWLICQGCPILDIPGKKCLVPGTGPCCGDCGCSMAIKLRSLGSACPLDKWDAELTFEEDYLLQKKLRDEQQKEQ